MYLNTSCKNCLWRNIQNFSGMAPVMQIENYAMTRVIRDLTKDLLRFVDSNNSRERLLNLDL